MATQYARQRAITQPQVAHQVLSRFSRPQCICQCHRPRNFSSATKLYRERPNYKESFGTRLRKALNDTKIKWYPIPVGLGIAFLGLGQAYRVNEREKAKRREDNSSEFGYVKISGDGEIEGGVDKEGRPRKRQRIRPTGPWLVLNKSVHTDDS